MPRKAIRMPALGSRSDAPIVVSHWFARRGERVWEGDRLVEVRAGIITFDVPAPGNGTLVRIVGREDDPVRPGSLLGYLAVADEDADADAGL